MPKLIAASIVMGILAVIATLIAVLEDQTKARPAPTPEPTTVFTSVNDRPDGTARNDCQSDRLPPAPSWATDGQATVTATVDRAIYECLFVHTRSGILSPDNMPPDRIQANVRNLTRAPAARECREQAALSPRENVVSASAAEQIRQRVTDCYTGLARTEWNLATPEQKSEMSQAVGDLLAAYAYSYHHLPQADALQCRATYVEAAKPDWTNAVTPRQAVATAERARRQYCHCVVQKLSIASDNPIRSRSC